MHATKTDDPSLIRRAGLGDPLARRALVQRYGPLLWSLCRRLDPEPEDAYQECWEKVLRGLPRFDPGGSARFSTWLSTVAHHHLVDRHRRRRPTEPLSDETAEEAPLIAAETPTADLDVALSRIPEARRRVLVMFHVHGLSLDTIAATEGVPVGTVKSRLHRGRAELLSLLEDPG